MDLFSGKERLRVLDCVTLIDFSSQAGAMGSARASPFVICKVLAAHKTKLITARARKNKRTAPKCSQRPFDTPNGHHNGFLLQKFKAKKRHLLID